jgi:hypothetical protein
MQDSHFEVHTVRSHSMRKRLRTDESGMALMTVLLVSMLAAALMAGVFAAISTDQRSLGFDRDQSQAYAAAHAGLEKLTTQLAQLFVTDVSPSAGQITTASAVPPSISGFNFVSPGGGSGYAVSFIPDPCASCPNKGNPMPSPSNDITTGPFAGFKGVITPYTLTVTARSTTGGAEVRLRREVQTVAVPVFQFGIFGEKSLSFFAGTNFTFGGRVHTNQHLFLATGGSATLEMQDKLTAVGEIVRAQLENGASLADAGAAGTNVRIPTVIGVSYRNLAASEGSVSAGPGSAAVGGWKNLSEVTYATNIRNTLTGAKRLDLPLVSQGAKPIDLIRRPALGSSENTTNAPVFGQRYYAQASLRILLSDRVSDFTGLPTITAAAPIPLDGSWTPAGSMPPVARSVGPQSVPISSRSPTSGSSTAGTITFGSLPAWLKLPSILTGSTGVVIGTGTIKNCTEMTLSSLKCDVTGATIPYDTDFTVPLDASIGGGSVAMRTGSSGTMTVGSGASARTITVSTTSPWMGTRGLTLGSRIIWSGNTPITCTGYVSSSNQLNGCSWSTSPSTSVPVTTHALSDAGQSLLGGYIKIERQNGPSGGTWEDVTTEILNLGFSGANQEGGQCADPTLNAVLRLQRLRDSGITAACAYGTTLLATDFWPNNLYDAREGAYRDVATTTPMMMGGIIGYVSLDVANLKKWFAGTIGTTGTQAWNNNGYIVYFSDRRGDHNEADSDKETGEYGAEDGIDPSENPWASPPNGVLDAGENVNESGEVPPPGVSAPTLETYGETPHPLGLPGGTLTAPYDATARPWTSIPNQPQARVNRQILFRRALKLINGGIVGGVNSLPDSGLTVAAENPVYVQGNYNAVSNDTLIEPNRPAAVIADAVTLLSTDWKDVTSFKFPNDRASRPALTTGYRFAMVSGRSRPFTRPGWGAQALWGTDGGVHNFMRMLEDWSGEATYYRGSMVSLYYSRQLVGTFRLNSNIYQQGTRNFDFDDDFLLPELLPPGTPMFRDVNTLRFRQILRPNQ